MASSVTTRLVRMGNSQGIRLSKPVIAQLRLGPEVKIEIHADHLVVRSAAHPRAGWEAMLAQQPACATESSFDEEVALTEWEKVEWEW